MSHKTQDAHWSLSDMCNGVSLPLFTDIPRKQHRESVSSNLHAPPAPSCYSFICGPWTPMSSYIQIISEKIKQISLTLQTEKNGSD